MATISPKPLPRFKKAFAFFIASLLCLTVSAQPVITSFSPASGPAGTIVTLTGTGFNSVADSNIVYIGGVKTRVRTSNGSQLTVQVPAGASTGLLTITNRGLTAWSLQAFKVTAANGGAISGSAFSLAGTLTTDKNPYSIASADLDGDGKSDLILVNAVSPFSIAIYPNNSTPGNISFDAPTTIPATYGAYDVKAGDLDGDGLLDMVVCNYSPGRITIYKNNSKPGQLSFAAGLEYTTSFGPWGLDIRDLNADGKPEIIFANDASGNVCVLPNQSNADVLQFGARLEFTNDVSAVGICTADINGDGLPDVVATAVNSIRTLINRSTPGGAILLVGTPYVNTPDTPIRVETADIDEDGKSDIIVSIKGMDGMAFYKNTSQDTAIAHVSYSLTFISVATAVGRYGVSDMDGDGHIDIVTTGAPFSVIRNTSTPGTIRMDRPSAAVNGNTGLAVADFDLDGHPDMASFDMDKNVLYLFRNTLEGPNIISVSPDSAVTGSTILIRGNHFTGATGVKLGSIAITDYKVLSDSVISAVIHPAIMSDSIEVQAPLRSGVYTGYKFLNAPYLIGLTPAYGMTGSQVTIKGRNFKNSTGVFFGGQAATKFTVFGDTMITAMVGQGASGAVTVSSKNGTGSFSGFTYIVKGNAPVISSFAPLTGPAGTTVTITGANFGTAPNSNIVFFGAARATVVSASSTQLKVAAPAGATYAPIRVMTDYKTGISAGAFGLTFEGGGEFTDSSFDVQHTTSFPVGSNAVNIAIADLDGDGLNDAAVANWGYDNDMLTIMRNKSVNNTLEVEVALTIKYTNLVYGVACGDLNSDGKPDLALATATGIYIYKNTSAPGHFSFDSLFIADKDAPANLVITDFNNDGRPDLVSGHNFLNHFFLYKNIGVNDYIAFADPVKYTFERSGMQMHTADIDGDGKMDVIEPNYERKTISVFRNTSSDDSLSLAPATTFASGGDARDLCIGDMDGDGKPEIMADYPYQDDHVISLYTNNSTPGNLSLERHDYATTLFGNSVSIGDLNGDGRPDLGILTDQGFNVFKNLSTTGNVKVDAYHRYSGLSNGEVFAIADFSGDGKPDLIAASSGTASMHIVPNVTGKNLGPLISSITPAIATKGDNISIEGQRFSAATSVMLGGMPATFNVVNDSLILAVTGNGNSGKVTVTTPYGSTTLDSFVYIAPRPVILEFSPHSAAIGDTIWITGLNFSWLKAVSLGNVPATVFTILTDTSMYAIVGNGASGSVQLMTETDTVAKAGFTFEAPVTPVLTSFSPLSAMQGMSVTLNGQHLKNVTQVFFGGIPAASFSVHSDSGITAVVGSGASGMISVSSTDGGAFIPGFTFRKDVPVLSGFSPATAGYGDTVTIRGYFNETVTGVTFGGYAANYFKQNGDSMIYAVVRDGGTGDVVVIMDTIRVSKSGFTYIKGVQVPVITAISPASGTTGTLVRISGTALSDATAVSFGGVPATAYSTYPDSIIAIVGAGASGDVSVTTAGGTATYSSFTYVAPLVPVITSITPPSGTAGAAIRISGANLNEAYAVSFGGVGVAGFTIDSNFITAILGTGASGDVVVSTPLGNATFPGFVYTETAKAIDAYPNPVQNGTVAIKHPAIDKTSYISFRDVNGMEVLKRDVAAGETVTTISGLNLMSGIYQVIWSGNDKVLVQRIVIP